MKIVLASDHAGIELRRHLVEKCRALGHEVQDLGTDDPKSSDYPDFAGPASKRVQAKEADRAILVCGSGIGMSIVANRHKGVRAVLAMVELQAKLARSHNDANVLCLGQRLTGFDLADAILKVFLEEPFAGDRHVRRVSKIDA